MKRRVAGSSPGPDLEGLAELVLERTIELAEIPAPTGGERRRASRVSEWWRADQLSDVHTDAVGNVWARARDGAGAATLVCAHLDTVFGEETDHRVRAESDRLVGPSVGDNSIGVAALSAMCPLLSQASRQPVWIIATTGEEGLGNLRGIRHALSHPPGPVAGLIALEGNYLGRVVTTGVGSVRWRVRFHGSGGHAWEEAHAPSAIHDAASAVHHIAGLTAEPARVAVNIGRIGGGEAINARARDAWFELDLRADASEALDQLQARARAVVTAARVGVEIEELGRRPAGRIEVTHPLVNAAVAALTSVGERPLFGASSTDANAAYKLGVPAIAIGVTRGAGEHTPNEWIETGPVAAGLNALSSTVNRFGEEL